MKINLPELALEVYAKIESSQQITRADLNIHFKATSDSRKNEALSQVIRSFLRFQHVAKKMNHVTNAVTFWIPDGRVHESADYVDASKYGEDDYLRIGRHGGEIAKPKLVIPVFKDIVKDEVVTDEMVEEALATVPNGKINKPTPVDKEKSPWAQKLEDLLKEGHWLTRNQIMVRLPGGLAHIIVRQLSIGLNKGWIKKLTVGVVTKYAAPSTLDEKFDDGPSDLIKTYGPLTSGVKTVVPVDLVRNVQSHVANLQMADMVVDLNRPLDIPPSAFMSDFGQLTVNRGGSKGSITFSREETLTIIRLARMFDMESKHEHTG